MGFFQRGVQFGGDGAMLVNPNTPASTDTFNAPFRVDPVGMVYVDYTNTPGASSESANGWAFSSSGQLFCTTDAITAASEIRQGLAVTETGRLHITFVEPSPKFTNGPFTTSSTGVLYVAGPIESQAAWFQWKLGITSSADAVSQWSDRSGNSRHLLQATATNQPALQSDGSILFDGVDNFLNTGAITLDQPLTIYLLFNQVTWTGTDRIFAPQSSAASAAGVLQDTATPQIIMFAGAAVGPISPTLNAFVALATVWNGASSSIQFNSNTPVTGDASTAGFGGFCIGSRSDGTLASNIRAKEAVLYAAAHDADQRARVINYLSALGNLGL